MVELLIWLVLVRLALSLLLFYCCIFCYYFYSWCFCFVVIVAVFVIAPWLCSIVFFFLSQLPESTLLVLGGPLVLEQD